MVKSEHQRIPKLRRGFRFQWEAAQENYVLLYPEGMIQLNPSAAFILQQVDGKRSVEMIVAELQRQFPEALDIAQDIEEFIEAAYERFWFESQ